MKKFFSLFCAVFVTVLTFGQSYGILVNGKTYFAGEPAGENEGFTQYLSHVQLQSGDYCQLYDASNKAAWAVTLNPYSVEGFTLNSDRYEVTVDGCYDFYIKLKYGQDELYIGNGSNCSEGVDITGGGEEAQMDTIYTWYGKRGESSASEAIEAGGTAAAYGGNSNVVVGTAQKTNWTIKLNKGFASGTYYVGITLDEALAAGDKLQVAAFRTSTSGAVFGIDFSADEASAATTCQVLFPDNLQTITTNVAPEDTTFTIPECAAGAKFIRIYRNSGSTGVYVANFTILREKGETPEPPVEPTLANGFYLIGQNGWDVAALSADLLFAANPDTEGEYKLTTTLAEGQGIKVVKVENDAIVAWYPDGMGNEYTVDAAHAGENKDIYFQETYKEDWAAFGGFFWTGSNEEPQPAAVVLPATLDVTNVSFRSEGMPDFIIEEGQDYAGTYFDMGAHDSANDTLLYAEWDVTIEPIKYNIAVDVYNTNSWRVQLYLLSQAGDTLKSLRYKGSSGQKGQFSIGSLDLSDLEAGDYKVRAHAATAWSAMKLKDVIFAADYQGVNVDLPGTLLPAYAELSANASVQDGAIAFKPSTANNEYAIWNVTFAEAGTFNVTIDITASNGHNYGVALLEGETEIGAVNEGGQHGDTGVKELGSITVPAAGSYKVKLTNATQWSEAVLNSITFATSVEPTLANGFYLIGQNGWDVAALSADLLFAANPDTEGEYKLTTTLAEGQGIKVVKVENDAIVAWYPDGMGNEYTVDAAHAGENKDIYFQETYKEDWAAFGGYFWTGSNEPPVVEKYCEKPSGHLKDPNFGDPSGRILLTIAKGEGNNIVVKIKNNNEAGNPKTGLNYLWVNAEGATGVVRYGDGTHDEADVEEVSVIVPFEEARESYNFINIHWAYSGWTGEWAIDGLTVSADELCEGAAPVEPTLANGFYLIGQNGWDVAALSADLLFAANPDTEGEYKLTTTLAEGQGIKVVKVENDAIVAWYPDGMGNEYTVDAAHAGENKDIYFQETYKEDWAAFGGYFWTGSNEPTAISNTAADVEAVKVLHNGMLLIRKGNKTYTIMGQAVK